MAENSRDIKRRIKSVKNTEQITKAMKMVSAAKLRRAQERVIQARPYTAKMEEVISSIAKAGGATHPMMVKRPVKKTGYVIITADRGLAGSYNAQIIRFTLAQLKDKGREDYTLFAVGRKGRDFFKRRNYPMAGEVTGLSDFPSYTDIKRITQSVIPMFVRGEVDEVILIFNKFNSPISQTPIAKKILPLEDVGGGKGEGQEKKHTQYLYEPSAEEVLQSLLPKYAETLIFEALLEAKASEHGARMTAMGNATDNASELIKQLTLDLNRARQAAITMQITEIVGGAEALK